MSVNYPSRKRKHDNVRGETTRDVNAARRVQTALKLKLEGHNWDQVAALAGFASRGAAHHAVMRELGRCITHDVEELRTQQLYMLQQIQARSYKAAMDEKDPSWHWAADRVANYSKRISELMGLDIRTDDMPGPSIIIQEVPAGYLEGPKE